MIYVTGDTHGIASRFNDPRLKNLKQGDTLIVCGDFGFLWNGSKDEINVLKKLSKKKYNICFVDGTHENFDMLNSIKIKKWNGGKVHHIASNIFHLMRGQVFEIEGTKIFTMGGGESPDIDIRFEMNTWSDLEIPTREELVEGVENLQKYGGKIDLIITHEPPAKIKDNKKAKPVDLNSSVIPPTITEAKPPPIANTNKPINKSQILKTNSRRVSIPEISSIANSC